MFSFLKRFVRPAACWPKSMPFTPDSAVCTTSVSAVIVDVSFHDSHQGTMVLDKVSGRVDSLPVSGVSLPVDVVLTDAVVGDDSGLYRRVLEDWVARGVQVRYARRPDGLAVVVEEQDRGHWLLLTR